MNTGVQIIKQLTDWIAGKESGIVFEDKKIDWSLHLPSEEKQHNPNFDSQGCVSFSLTSVLETQFDALLADGTLKKEDCTDYLDADGFFNFSDRYLAKMSDTMRMGNSMQKVVDTVRKCGLVAERDWPFTDDLTWDTFYAEIPQEIKDKGKKFFERFSISYEWVLNGESSLLKLQTHVKQAPLQVAAPVCESWETGNPSACAPRRPEHAFMIYKIDEQGIYAFDQYYPFQKLLPLKYPIVNAMKIIVKPQPVVVVTPIVPELFHNFNKPIYYKDRTDEVFALQQALALEGLFTIKPTGYFGDITLDAVRKFQEKYANEILAPLGLNGATGIVGPATRKKLNSLYYQSNPKSKGILEILLDLILGRNGLN